MDGDRSGSDGVLFTILNSFIAFSDDVASGGVGAPVEGLVVSKLRFSDEIEGDRLIVVSADASGLPSSWPLARVAGAISPMLGCWK